MNKIQIKAEILATLAALSTSAVPNPALLSDLKQIEDKNSIIDILIKELISADEHRSLLICWLMTELIDKDTLNNELWNVIKSPEYNDHIKMVAFNMLKDLGNKIDYDVISEYFEKFNELINTETKELLETAIMNPEAQIDFMDFLSAINDEDKILLIKSLEEDYANDALANILIPVFISYKDTNVGNTALEILGKTKSQLAFHALSNALRFSNEEEKSKINKAISELKISGVRVDNTLEFYRNILNESKPYKSYTSFPDGHGNVAILFSRIRPNKTLQFLAVVVSPQYGILDAFGFNSMNERDFFKIVDKFYNYNEKYEISEGIVKYILNKAVENSYKNNEPIPYEYTCWESILLDIEEMTPSINIEKVELNQKIVDEFCLSDYVQNWFFDEITSQEFKDFIIKLSTELKNNNFNIDLDKFIATNFDLVYTKAELECQIAKFKFAAFLRYLKGDNKNAQILYSLEDNYSFLTNVLRKSIYEYYVGQRYIISNQRKTSNMFEKKMRKNDDEFELLQLDMIISSIEAKWVDNA